MVLNIKKSDNKLVKALLPEEYENVYINLAEEIFNFTKIDINNGDISERDESLARLINTLRDIFDGKKISEITYDINPEDYSTEDILLALSYVNMRKSAYMASEYLAMVYLKGFPINNKTDIDLFATIVAALKDINYDEIKKSDEEKYILLMNTLTKFLETRDINMGSIRKLKTYFEGEKIYSLLERLTDACIRQIGASRI